MCLLLLIRELSQYRRIRSRYDNLPKELKASCIFSLEKGIAPRYNGYLCLSPMFFMNQLAVVMGNPSEEGLKFVAFNIPKRYEKAKSVISSNVLKISKPHFADTYVILSE